MTRTILRSLKGLSIAITVFGLQSVAQQMPQSTTEKIEGATTTKTEELRGTVVYVEGNKLVVRMSSGDIRQFDVPESRKFIVDGNEVTVHDLKPGTRLHATVTTTTTPVTQRTTTIGSGKVWFVSGNSVIVTLPNNENRMYKVKDSYKFMVDGQPASVHDLRKGMTISAEKIVETPTTEIASNTTVTGTAPRAPVEAAATPAPAPAPVAPAAPAPAEPAPAAAPAEQATTMPAKLPKTGSPLPLVGLAGLAFLGASLVLGRLRRV
jgi:LPXTG-motif cell wall-anchored protein